MSRWHVTHDKLSKSQPSRFGNFLHTVIRRGCNLRQRILCAISREARSLLSADVGYQHISHVRNARRGFACTRTHVYNREPTLNHKNPCLQQREVNGRSMHTRNVLRRDAKHGSIQCKCADPPLKIPRLTSNDGSSDEREASAFTGI